MATKFMRNGEVWYRSDNGQEYQLASDKNWSGYNVDPQSGTAVHHDWKDWIVPAAVGGIFAGGPFLQGGAAAAGASGATGGTLPAGSIPIAYAHGATVPNAGALGASAAGAAPLGSFMANAGNAGANVGGNALASSIRDKLLSPQGFAGLGASIAGLVAANRGGSGETDAATNALLQEALKRSQRVDPLHQAVTQLAFSRLPMSARNGITLTGK